MKVVAYIRVSSKGQLDGYGLDIQEADVRAWAAENEHELVSVYRDGAVKGSLPAHERPGLKALLDALAFGKAAGVVIPRLDRLARELHIQEAVLAAMWTLDCKVFSASDNSEIKQDDPSDPMRTAMRQVQGAFAQLERAMIVKRLNDGRRAKAATGRKSVGSYRFGTRGGGTGRERDEVVHPQESVIVERILALRSQGKSYRDIVSVLNEEGHAPRRAAAWSPMTVKRIVDRVHEDWVSTSHRKVASLLGA